MSEWRLGVVKGQHVWFIKEVVQCGWNTKNVKDRGKQADC